MGGAARRIRALPAVRHSQTAGYFAPAALAGRVGDCSGRFRRGPRGVRYAASRDVVVVLAVGPVSARGGARPLGGLGNVPAKTGPEVRFHLNSAARFPLSVWRAANRPARGTAS